ncbi:MAG: hypothetical protein JXA20_05890 [Spirochaetes bacterium]|nr:hypothetical protein [Spirochaetota bacterium]
MNINPVMGTNQITKANRETLVGPNPMDQGIIENARESVKTATRSSEGQPELQRIREETNQKGNRIDMKA